MKEEFYMRKIGFITNINYIDGLINKLSITIFNEETNEVETIYPTILPKNYPYQMFETVEYNKEDNSIKPYVPKDINKLDLSKEELKFMQKSLLFIAQDKELGPIFQEHLLNTYDMLSNTSNKIPHK